MKKMCGKKPGGSRIFNATIYNVEKYHRALKIFKFVVARHFSNQRGSTILPPTFSHLLIKN